MRERNVVVAKLAAIARVGLAATAAASFLSGSACAAQGPIGVDLPMTSTPFWQAYAKYVSFYGRQLGAELLPPIDSNYDVPKQIADIKKLLDLGSGGILTTPVESGGISTALKAAAVKKIPVVTVDVAPEHGPVAMVVRVDNRAYGRMACNYIAERVTSGVVVQIMGDLASVNGRDRGEGFRACMKDHANLKLLEIPAEWHGDVAAKALDGLLVLHHDISAIYMHSAGVFLAACRIEISEIGFPGAAFLAIVAPVAELRFAIGA